jgi:hypothetical protein
MNEQVLSLIRYGLAFLGGFLASGSNAIFTSDEWTQASGAVLTLVAVGWSAWVKRNSTRVPNETLTSAQQRAISK